MKYILIFTFSLVLNLAYTQCMQIDLSVNRQCTDGQGTITILTGDPDSVTYSIDGGGTFVNTPQFSNLNVGMYNIVVQDTTGCVVNLTAEIEPFLEVGSLVTTPSCATPPSGVVDIRGYLGKPLYQYSFDGGQTFYTADSIKTELAAGTYDVVIKDSYGCEVDTMVTVDAYPAISPTITPLNEQCNGSGPGAVDVVFSNGATYDFSLNGGAVTTGTSYNNANLSAGFYVLDITDANGCTSPFQFEVGADLVDDSVQINYEYCHYGNGAIEVSGFLGQSPYEYSIDAGTTYLPSGVFTDLSQGEYVVFIKDATGCVKEDTVFVTNFGGVNATPSPDDTICYGNEAIVSVSHNGGVTASYEWSNGLSDTQVHVVSPLTTTTYSVIVTDDFGCKDTAETTITVENYPVVSLSETQIHACMNEEVSVTASGATTYVWSTGDTGEVLTYIASGNEVITVTGYNGQCTDEEQSVIVLKPSPTVVADANLTSINTHDSIFFYSTGSITSTTLWDFGDGFSSQESNPYHKFDFAGAYMVMLTGEMGGCEAQDSVLVYVGFVNVDENLEDNTLVYPNPANDFVTVRVAMDATFKLLDVNGKLVLSRPLRKGENRLNVHNLQKGVYIGRIVSGDDLHSFRLVVH